MSRAATPPHRRLAIGVFVLTALIYMVTAPGHLGSVDMRSELAVAQSMVGNGSAAVTTDLPYVNVTSVTAPNGELYSPHGLGQSILLLPAAAIGRLAGCPGDPSQCTPSGQHAADFASSFLDGVMAAGAVTMLLLLALELGAGMVAATALALLFGFTTIEWAYAHDAFDVGPTTFFLLLSVFALRRGVTRDAWPWLLLGGAAAGFAVLLRAPSLACLPVLFAYVLVAAWRRPKVAVARLLGAFTAGAGVMLAVVAWYNWARFGSPTEYGYSYASDYFGFDFSGIGGGVAGLLFSPGRSIFLFSPLLLAGLAGIPLLWRRDRALTALVLTLVVVNIGLYGGYLHWWGDWAWGARFLVPMTPFLLLPLLPILERWRALKTWMRGGIAGLAVVGVLIQLLDVSLDAFHQIQLARSAGADPDVQFWDPTASAIWRNTGALVQLLKGSAPYPTAYQFTDMSTGLPTKTVPDVWWSYALANGVNAVVVLAALAAIVLAAVFAWSRIRATMASRSSSFTTPPASPWRLSSGGPTSEGRPRAPRL